MNIFFQGSQGGGWLRGKISNIDIPPLCLWEGGEEGAFVDHNSAECFSSMFALSMVAAVTLHKEGAKSRQISLQSRQHVPRLKCVFLLLGSQPF